MRQACLKTVFEIAKKDKKILFIGSDLGPNVLKEFKTKFPKRFFIEGVAEQSVIGMASGLALSGFKPYVNTISTFITRRCFEQVVVDVCLHNLPVTLIGNGGGLVYAPLGPTHQAIEDISIMRTLPNMTVISPCDANEMTEIVKQSRNFKSPIYIRIARGGEKIITNKKKIKIGKSVILKKIKKINILTTGIMAQKAIEVANKLRTKKIDVGVIHFSTVKPLDKKTLNKILKNSENCFTLEENVIAGGFGSAVLEYASLVNFKTPKIKIFGIKDKFIDKYGNQEELLNYSRLDVKSIMNNILKFINKK